LKLGTTWPLPPKLLKKYLSTTSKILVVEEVLPFLEENVKILALEQAREIGLKTFYGKSDGSLPRVGELNPDLVVSALSTILGIKYEARTSAYGKEVRRAAALKIPERERAFCPGCPHRASFLTIRQALQMDNRKGFVCGDIGCYASARFACGFKVNKTLHAMGSGAGIASGFGKLGQFGMDQPSLAVCGDSTFFHAVLPALVNAVHHQSNMTLVVLDNSGTAMTGFQPHPGLAINAMGEKVPSIDIAKVCEAVGAKVEIRDPFDLTETQKTLNRLMEDQEGVKVLILRQICALSPEKKGKKKYEMRVDESLCLGERCGCNRLCTRIFRCSGLVYDQEKKKARIDDVICVGCGVCSLICPTDAIKREAKA
jgi:indolepyruvate ferredoxin oxidoreductase alpha subunit